MDSQRETLKHEKRLYTIKTRGTRRTAARGFDFLSVKQGQRSDYSYFRVLSNMVYASWAILMIEAIRAQDKRLEIFQQPQRSFEETRIKPLYLIERLTYQQIAEKLGISRDRVRYVIRHSDWRKKTKTGK